MDLYTFLFFLGAAGLLTMALQGLGGGHGDHGHGAGGNAGHSGHAGHGGHAGHAGHAGNAAHGSHGHSQDANSHGHGHGHESGFGKLLWSFASPRTLFSIALGMGVAGRALRPLFGTGTMLLIAAIGLGIIFEWALVRPIWNLAFRFASKPALMLESCVEDEGTAVTGFDKNGQGIISVDLDGQVVQMLATLRADDRALGAAVRAGDRVRIADVDSARNRCTVAVL